MAKAAFSQNRFTEAAAQSMRYMRSAGEGSEKFESAQFYLAESLARLGLTHAAVVHYVKVASQRRAPKFLPRALAGLETLSLNQPIDRERVLLDLVANTDFGRLTDSVGDFVHYWQAIANLRGGLDQWARDDFSRIRRHSYYFLKALYAASVRLLVPYKLRQEQRIVVASFAELFGASDLSAALDALRRRGDADSPLAYALKALLDRDNNIDLHLDRLPQKWEVILAMVGFARVAGEAEAMLRQARLDSDEELGHPFGYQVKIGSLPIYHRTPRFENRAEIMQSLRQRTRNILKTKGKALHSLARLLFEEKRFTEANTTLKAIPPGTELGSEILLERAWSKYHSGDPHRAMGLLYALDAPIYRKLFAPEKYALRGLIYRKFCHFRAAYLVARRFRADNQTILDALRSGVPISKIDALHRATLRRDPVRSHFLFGKLLERELKELERYKSVWHRDNGFASLQRIYKIKQRETRKLIRAALKKGVLAVAEQILDTEEQVHLLEYEVGQAMFERISEHQGERSSSAVTPKVPLSSSRVYYRFSGEYWTDELPRFKFNISNRCVE